MLPGQRFSHLIKQLPLHFLRLFVRQTINVRCICFIDTWRSSGSCQIHFIDWCTTDFGSWFFLPEVQLLAIFQTVSAAMSLPQTVRLLKSMVLFVFCQVMAIGTAITTFVGQIYLVLKNMSDSKKVLRLSLILACALAVGLGIILFACAPYASFFHG